jgi:hypothetical protein
MGLIVPSARSRLAKNVVVFPDKLDAGNSIELMAKEELLLVMETEA